MKKQLALAVVLAVATSTAAAAERTKRTYVELGFSQEKSNATDALEDDYETDFGGDFGKLSVSTRVDDIKANGGYLSGSVELGDDFYLFGGYQKSKADDDIGVHTTVTFLGVTDTFHEKLDTDVDVDQARIGFGYRHTLSDRVEWTGELSYINTRLDGEIDDIHVHEKYDDTRLALGLHGNLAANFEGWVKANYTDGDFYDGQFSGTLGALVKFNDTWGIVGEAELGSDESQYRVGVRASF